MMKLYTILSATFASASILTPGLLVPTHQGPVLGTLVSPTVRQFLGVPYGASTASSNRFLAPKPAPLRLGILNANKFTESCPQDQSVGDNEFLTIIGAVPPPNQGENCLSLNIWAPSIGRKQGTAVMIWVHGGAFQFGSSDVAAYHGQSFVKNNDDVIIVTINYRLNIFGSAISPQLLAVRPPIAQNVGLLDVDAAIQWVFSNIAAFGGDPQRITIFGESAGAAAVDAYAFSHVHDKLVKGIISESGQAVRNSTAITPAPTDPSSPWNVAAKAAGCGTTNDAKQFSCMQHVPFQTLRDIISNLSLPFGVIPDGITLFADAADRSARGDFLKVPLMTGTNANEEDVFLLITEILTNTTVPDFDAVSDATTAAGFFCPSARQAKDRAKAGVATFRYRYEAIFPNLDPTPVLRAFHSSEIALVFGTFGDDGVSAPGVAPTANEIALSKYMQSAWVTFARDPANGLTKKAFNWPRFDKTGEIIELGNGKNPTGGTFTNAGVFDAVCNFTTTAR